MLLNRKFSIFCLALTLGLASTASAETLMMDYYTDISELEDVCERYKEKYTVDAPMDCRAFWQYKASEDKFVKLFDIANTEILDEFIFEADAPYSVSSVYPEEEGRYVSLLFNDVRYIDRDNGDLLVYTGFEDLTGGGIGHVNYLHADLDPVAFLGYSNKDVLDIRNDEAEFEGDNISIYDIHQAETWRTSAGPSRKLVLSDEFGTECSVGKFEGTNYCEDVYLMNTAYYFFNPYTSTIEVPIETTRNGYFIIDISELNAGMYTLYGLGDSRVIFCVD